MPFGKPLGITLKDGTTLLLLPPEPMWWRKPWEMLQDPRMHPALMMGGPPSEDRYWKLLEQTAEDPTRISWWMYAPVEDKYEFVGVRGVFRIGSHELRRGESVGGDDNVVRYHGGQIFAAVHPDYWGLGIAQASARVVIDHLFNDLGHTGVYTQALVSNIKSTYVLRKLGFVPRTIVMPESSRGYEEGGEYYPYQCFDLLPTERAWHMR